MILQRLVIFVKKLWRTMQTVSLTLSALLGNVFWMMILRKEALDSSAVTTTTDRHTDPTTTHLLAIHIVMLFLRNNIPVSYLRLWCLAWIMLVAKHHITTTCSFGKSWNFRINKAVVRTHL